MVQGRSTKIISMIMWIRTSRLSINKCLSADPRYLWEKVEKKDEKKDDQMMMATLVGNKNAEMDKKAKTEKRRRRIARRRRGLSPSGVNQ